jgi:hypothetical protein
VQVFRRRHCETIHALGWPASEKRQGTKSRWVGHWRCRGLYGAPRPRRHVDVDLPMGVRRPRPRGSDPRAIGYSPPRSLGRTRVRNLPTLGSTSSVQHAETNEGLKAPIGANEKKWADLDGWGRARRYARAPVRLTDPDSRFQLQHLVP